jgi:hypothetical protein
MADALSKDEGCSQYTRKRRRSHPFDCSVCLEDDLDSWKGYHLEKCNHKLIVTCVAGLVKSSMSATATIISCPQVECDENLTLSDIRFIFRDDAYVWHDYSNSTSMAMLESEIASGGSTRRCPAERCNYTFVFEPDGTEGIRFLCPQCQSTFCLGCRANGGQVGPAHDGT